MLMTLVWIVVSWACVKILRLRSPMARFLIFLIPLIAAFVARVRLSPETAPEVISACFVIALLLLSKDYYHYRKFRKRIEDDSLPSETIQPLVDNLAKEFGMVRVPRALVSRNFLISPLAAGVRNTILVIPQQIVAALTEEELRLLLAHEIAHIKRKDIILKWILLLLRRLSFLNPLAEWPYRWLSLETERGADRMAITVTRKRGTFARMLLKVEESLALSSTHSALNMPSVVSRANSYLPARIEELASPFISKGIWSTLFKVGAIFIVYKLICFKPVEIWLQLLN